MSFFNSKPWAKIPTDLLENKAMIQAEKELGEEFRAAPVLLYLAGATKADEDGIFDIGDGSEFAALIKSKSPEIVFQVISVMVKYRIFAHVPKSSIYLFAEWEYSTRQNGKALKNRFAIACELWKKKQEEATFFCPQLTKIDTLGKNVDVTSDKCSNTIQPRVNECFNTIQGQESGIPQIRREEIREDETRAEQIIPELDKSTHTRIEGVGEEEQPEPSEPVLGSSGSGFEKRSEQQQIPEEQERLITVPNWSIVPEAENLSETLETDSVNTEKGDASFVPTNGEKNEGDLNTIIKLLNNFFCENNVGYNISKGLKTVKAIADDILHTAKSPEQAAELAKNICFEFKKMHDEPQGAHWHNVPLYPAYMARETIWCAILSRVSLIYGTVAEPKENLEKRIQNEWAEVLAERNNPATSVDSEYIRFGIDPADPNRAARLLQAKAVRGIS